MPLGMRLFEPAQLGLDDKKYWTLENQYDNSSIMFAIEMLPTLWELLQGVKEEITLLDVGARTGAGTHLIAYLHQTFAPSRNKIVTTGIDLESEFYEYARKNYPFSNMMVGDIFQLPDTAKYDIVICSHTIEHVPSPETFVERLKGLAKRYAIVACPYNEVELYEHHYNTLDDAFFERTGALNVKVYDAQGWHLSKSCIAVYKGEAG